MPITDFERKRLRILLLRAMQAYEERYNDDSEVFNPADDVFLDGIIDGWLDKVGYRPT